MDDAADFAAWQDKVRGANISTTSLLATDYLNHFNEIIMLLGMVQDMPDIIEECRNWHPKTYVDHFRDSGFRDKELAVEAYDHVPARYKLPFEETIEQMNRVVESAIEKIDTASAEGDVATALFKAETATRLLQHLLDLASAIIHGADVTMSQADIDAFMRS
jgi:hypothetical protein